MDALDEWYRFSAGYDPAFTWWVAAPYKKMVDALDRYRLTLREDVLGIESGEDDPIVGTPIGRDALVADLAAESIPYTPEELLSLGERELAWGEREMKKAAAALGFGEDWRAALEKVKTLHAPPGRQPELIRELAREAEEYLERHDLVSVPPLAKEIWRMRMMSPERQKVNPFFTGGEVISVSFPTDTMEHPDKLMSLRGNNVHFARATVFHELVPGHHLQAFMTARYNAHRGAFQTPFWREGWALYWEMLLWDRGYARGPEDEIGALFWRNHRAAPHPLLAALPSRPVDAGAVRRLPGRAAGPRTRERQRGGAAQLQRKLPALVPAGLHGGRPAVPGAADRAGRAGPHDGPAVPRRRARGRTDAGGDGPGAAAGRGAPARLSAPAGASWTPGPRRTRSP